MIIAPPALEIDKTLYAKAKKILTDLDGTWLHRKFVFKYEPAPVFKNILETGLLPEKNPHAFFPTPPAVIDHMFLMADSDLTELFEVRNEMARDNGQLFRILEPEAGTGQIAKRLREIAGECQIDTVEVNSINQAILTEEGFNPYCGDFLEYNTDNEILYDFIFMNPPFSTKGLPQAYIAHFNHAYYMLKPGGKIVLAAPTSFRHNSHSMVKEFLKFLTVNDSAYCEECDDKAFKESGTVTDTCLVAVEKPYNQPSRDAVSEKIRERFEIYARNQGDDLDRLIKTIKVKSKQSDMDSVSNAITDWCKGISKKGLSEYSPVFLSEFYIDIYREEVYSYLYELEILTSDVPADGDQLRLVA